MKHSGGKIWLVLNSASGSHEEGIGNRIAQRLETFGSPPVQSFDCRTGNCPDPARARAEGVGLIVVHGGDGTINSTIQALRSWDGAILPLPGGTANLLCHRLFDECGVDAVLDQFGRGELTPRQLQAVKAEDFLAISEMLVGPAALWADAREELREANVAGTIAATKDAAEQSAQGPMIHMVDPAIGRAAGYPGIRVTPQAQGMFVEGYAQDNLLELAQQGMAILTHDFRQGPHDDLGVHPAITCRSEDGSSMELMIDGERASVASGTEFSLAPLGVDLLGPSDD